MLEFGRSDDRGLLWPALRILLLILGALEFTKVLYRLFKGTFVYFLRPGKSVKAYGPWAIVTGATDGIGRAYADALAKRGLNLVLISRTQAKLDAAASEIQKAYKVQTQIIAADFSALNASNLAGIQKTLSELDVGLLINNVGLSYDHAEFLDAISDKEIDDLIQINIVSATKIAKLVLPGMKERKKPSAIINIGSAAATVAPSGPLYAVYAGTKAYIDMFSKSLNLEYAKYGISVQNQAPMYVATKMSKIRRPTLDAPSPRVWAESAVKHIGYEATSCPYWYLLNFHTSLRTRYYRKKAREAKTA